ncbi:hypothetical protein [Roseomonas rosulenta]|uniref:hypothetical protein n=1 Tax=Roseomonas rosulenta TaxID=2748667 RepID=UPI0018E06035|nr:hypothetical protein [Roseomonas rosulenta]
MTGFDDIGSWSRSWAWGVPLIVATVVVHVLGLVLIRAGIARAFAHRMPDRAAHMVRFAVGMGVAVLLTTVLHIIQAAVWAAAYVLLGAAPTIRQAMLYSINAMTAYGHTVVYLAPDLQMLGALQALNGLILFGLTTAFLYGMVQYGWPERSP